MTDSSITDQTETPPAATAPPETADTQPADPEGGPEPEVDRQEAADDGLGDAGRAALKRERDAAKAAKQEAESAASERDAANERIRELEAAELRRTVAGEKRLTPEQAALLVGDDADQLAAHADQLLAAYGPPARPPGSRPIEALRSGTGITVDTADAGDIASEVLRG